MPASDNVQIIYEAVVRGQEKLEELARANEALKRQTESQTKTIDKLREANTKSDSAMDKARKQIKAFRQEMFAATFTIGAVVAAFTLLSKHSEQMGAGMERVGKVGGNILGAIGDAAVESAKKVMGFFGALSGGANFKDALKIASDLSKQKEFTEASQIAVLTTEAQLERLKGNELIALEKQRVAERIKLQQQFKGETLDILQKMLDERITLQKAAFEKERQIDLLGAQAATAKERGDQVTALLKQQEAERLRIFKDNKDARQRLIEEEVLARQEAERESLRLTELGLQRHSEILKDYKRDVVSTLQGGTSDVLFNLMQGNVQGIKDALKGVLSGLQRAMADALSKAIFTSLAGGKGNFFENFKNILTGKNSTTDAVDKTTRAVEQTARKIDDSKTILQNVQNTNARIADCVCTQVQMMNAARSGGTMTATITAPEKNIWQKLGDITGAIGSGLGAIGGFAGGFGGSGGGGGISIPSMPAPSDFHPQLNFAPGSLGPAKFHRGGFVGAFAGGGEVPALVQPGEFIVNKSAASDNKEVLRDINKGSKRVRGTTNVFMIKTNDAQSFAQMLSSPSSRNMIESAVIRAVMSNGQVRDTIKSFAK